ncbi:MAG: protein kinase [bacterium]
MLILSILLFLTYIIIIYFNRKYDRNKSFDFLHKRFILEINDNKVEEAISTYYQISNLKNAEWKIEALSRLIEYLKEEKNFEKLTRLFSKESWISKDYYENDIFSMAKNVSDFKYLNSISFVPTTTLAKISFADGLNDFIEIEKVLSEIGLDELKSFNKSILDNSLHFKDRTLLIILKECINRKYSPLIISIINKILSDNRNVKFIFSNVYEIKDDIWLDDRMLLQLEAILSSENTNICENLLDALVVEPDSIKTFSKESIKNLLDVLNKFNKRKEIATMVEFVYECKDGGVPTHKTLENYLSIIDIKNNKSAIINLYKSFDEAEDGNKIKMLNERILNSDDEDDELLLFSTEISVKNKVNYSELIDRIIKNNNRYENYRSIADELLKTNDMTSLIKILLFANNINEWIAENISILSENREFINEVLKLKDSPVGRIFVDDINLLMDILNEFNRKKDKNNLPLLMKSIKANNMRFSDDDSFNYLNIALENQLDAEYFDEAALKVLQPNQLILLFHKNLSIKSNSNEVIFQRITYLLLSKNVQDMAFISVLETRLDSIASSENIVKLILEKYSEVEAYKKMALLLCRELEKKESKNHKINYILRNEALRSKDIIGAYKYSKKIVDRQSAKYDDILLHIKICIQDENYYEAREFAEMTADRDGLGLKETIEGKILSMLIWINRKALAHVTGHSFNEASPVKESNLDRDEMEYANKMTEEELKMKLVKLYMKNIRFTKNAIILLQELIDNEKYKIEARKLLVNTLMKTGYMEASMEHVKMLLNNHLPLKENKKEYYRIARMFEEYGGYSYAKWLYEKIASIDFVFEDIDERINKLNNLKENTSSKYEDKKDNIETEYMLALDLWNKGDFDRAKGVLEKIAVVDINYKDVNERLSLLENERFGSNYVKIKKLGGGGQAIVYLGKDIRDNKEVAIKVSYTTIEDEKKLMHFKNEIQAMKKMNHENIIRIFEEGMEKDLFYYVMDYMNDGSLRNKLKKHERLVYDQMKNYIIPILKGLNYAHENGVIHRDLKPENIMFNSKGMIKIADFGSAKLETLGATTSTGGDFTFPYASPEQYKKSMSRTEKIEIGKEADIWAMGVMMYEMSTGRLPFEGEDIFALSTQVLYEEPKYDDMEQKMKDIIKGCLAKDAEKRIKNTGELIKMLE